VNERDEVERIRAEYDRRAREIPAGFYSFDGAANLFALHAREKALRDAFASISFLPLTGRKLLEIGCGTGEWFGSFERLGLARADLFGIELDSARAEAAKARAPGATIEIGNAGQLRFGDASFDVVFQSTVFSSVLQGSLQSELAAEMTRVLKPGGAVAWYDFSFDNPRNKSVRGVRRRDIARLFPTLKWRFWRVTLAPPVARRLVPLSWPVAEVLQWLKLANTHLMAVGVKS
jgi:ubiquinone/menaquinone biosynthesis C-methylase UbiE